MKVVTLAFENQDAAPKDVEIHCTKESVPHIMAWYGAYFAGDDYAVFINGTPVLMDLNGEYEAPTIEHVE